LLCHFVAACIALGACGGTHPGTGNDSGDEVSSTPAMPGPDAGRPEVPPALTDAGAPQIIRGSGPVLEKPRLVAVTFASDPNAAIFDTLLSQLGPSSYWSEATTEYGVEPATSTPPVHLVEMAPGKIEYNLIPKPDGMLSFDGADGAITSWLAEKLDGTHREFPAADGQTVYAIFYPRTTEHIVRAPGVDGGSDVTISLCRLLAGYHSAITLGDGRFVPYVVIPEGCSDDKDLSVPASHELIEAATDADGIHRPAWRFFDPNHRAWDLVSASEVTDPCGAITQPVHVPGIDSAVPRSWSNRAAFEGHHPCVPSQGQANDVATPDAPDEVSYTSKNGPIVTRGVRVPVGTTRTIDLHLTSDAPHGAWSIVLANVGDNSNLKIDFDRTTGESGETIKMTLHALAKPEKTDFTLLAIASVDDAKNPQRIALAPLVVTFE
jgi:hypothetical protein